jgi:hypothetical protein
MGSGSVGNDDDLRDVLRILSPCACEHLRDVLIPATVHIGARGRLREPLGGVGIEPGEGPGSGSGLVFEDGGEHELKVVPEQWRLLESADGRRLHSSSCSHLAHDRTTHAAQNDTMTQDDT